MKHYFGMGILAALGAASMTTPAQAQLPEWGGSEDVPTWNVGDSWDFARDFAVDLNGFIQLEINPGAFLTIKADLSIDFAEDFGLQVSEVSTVNPNLNGSVDQLAYKRSRTHGTLGAIVGGTLALFDPNNPNNDLTEFTLDVTGSTLPANTGVGENWIGVGDLSQIRESFGSAAPTTATLTVNGHGPNGNSNLICTLLTSFNLGFVCGDSLSANIGVSLTLDHAMSDAGVTTGGLELLDFPTVDKASASSTGEIWAAKGTRRLNGTVQLALPAFDLDESLAFSLPQDVDYLYYLANKNVTAPGNIFTDCTFVTGALTPTNDIVYYSPTAKEMPYWEIGRLVVPINEGSTISGRVTLRDFTTRIEALNDVTLSAGAPITDLVISPARPAPGASFTVSGTIADTSTTVNAEVLVPGGAGSTGSGAVASNAFSVNLTAPTINDQSPMPALSGFADQGSFGIRLTHDGATGSVSKTVTVRVGSLTPPPQSAAGDWKFYE